MSTEIGMVNLKIEFFPPCPEENRIKWVAFCPEIDLGSQGDSFEEACLMLKEAVQVWLECCIEHGTLHMALQECGFTEERISSFEQSMPMPYKAAYANTAGKQCRV